MEKSFYAPQAFRENDAGPNQCFGIELLRGDYCQLNCEACYKKLRLSPSACIATRQALEILSQPSDTTPATPTPVVTNYIDQAQKSGFQEVAFLGGEPTLHSDIAAIIRHTQEVGLRPILCTNGMRIGRDPELLEALNKTSSVVVTHAYLPGKEGVIDAYSRKEGYAAQLKTAIEHLREGENIQLVLEMPLIDSLYPHAFEFFTYCRDQGVIPFIEISRSHDQGCPTTSVTPEQVEKLYMQCLQYDLEHHPELAACAIVPPAYGNPCTMSITGVHVKNHGRGDYGGVYSCCAQHLRHGDLKEQSLEEILKSPTLAVYRDQDAYIVGPCRDCELYNVCKGGCRGEAFLRFGCPRASSPACHRIPPEVRNDPTLMAPQSCEGCPAEHAEGCALLHKR